MVSPGAHARRPVELGNADARLANSIPDEVARHTVGCHGDVGAAWLARLPGLLEGCARRWSLTIGAPFPGLSYNYVAPAERADGIEAVLKVGFPSRELMSEMAALAAYDGRGAARLLEHDREQGALLLERLRPGATLADVAATDDEAATVVGANVMRRLWRPAPPAGHSFQTVADHACGLERLRSAFGGDTGPLPPALVERAERLFRELIDSTQEQVLTHGDLHHFNIIAAHQSPGRGPDDAWLAIDCWGIVADPGCEVGAFLLNPFDPPPVEALERRLGLFAGRLGIDRERLRDWGLARAMLSACWSVEDRDSFPADAITTAERLAAIRP